MWSLSRSVLGDEIWLGRRDEGAHIHLGRSEGAGLHVIGLGHAKGVSGLPKSLGVLLDSGRTNFALLGAWDWD